MAAFPRTTLDTFDPAPSDFDAPTLSGLTGGRLLGSNQPKPDVAATVKRHTRPDGSINWSQVLIALAGLGITTGIGAAMGGGRGALAAAGQGLLGLTAGFESARKSGLENEEIRKRGEDRALRSGLALKAEERAGDAEKRARDAEERAKKGFAEGSTSSKVARVRETGVPDPDLSDALNLFAVEEFRRKQTETKEDRELKKRATEAQFRNLDEPNRNPPRDLQSRFLLKNESLNDGYGTVIQVPYLINPDNSLSPVEIRRPSSGGGAGGGGAGAQVPISGLPSGIRSGLSYTSPLASSTSAPSVSPSSASPLPVARTGVPLPTEKPAKQFNVKSAVSEIADKSNWTTMNVEVAIVNAMKVGMNEEAAVRYVAKYKNVLLSQ